MDSSTVPASVEPETTTSGRSLRRTGRRGAVACGCALAASAFIVAAKDPSAPGSRFPQCTFHRATGLWCPGCGMTRATHHLLHGDVLTALGSNMFTPLVLLTIVATWWAWTCRSFGLAPSRVTPMLDRLKQRMSTRWGVVLIGSMVVYAVLRNVPAAPFDTLAP